MRNLTKEEEVKLIHLMADRAVEILILTEDSKVRKKQNELLSDLMVEIVAKFTGQEGLDILNDKLEKMRNDKSGKDAEDMA